MLASVAVVAWSVWKGASWESLMDVQIHWDLGGVALGCVALRDAGYVARLLILARGELTLKRATSSIVLWELASALTPSVVGGSAVASFILHRNGLELGAKFGHRHVHRPARRTLFLVGRPCRRLGGRPGCVFARIGALA